jgi:hypothetical protein
VIEPSKFLFAVPYTNVWTPEESVVAWKKSPSPRSETPKVYSLVGLNTEFGALAVNVMRQFELGGRAVMSETFMVETSNGALSTAEVGSAEYKTERISSGSSIGTTAVPPSSGLPPRRTSCGKSVTCDPGIPPTFATVGTGSFGGVGKALPSTGTGIPPPVAPGPLIWRVTKV